MQNSLTMRDVYRARRQIASIARRTPLLYAPALSEETEGTVYFKLETLQETGSFKVRGAANTLLSLNEDEKARGVIAFSTGNHGRAVAYVAKQLGITAVICLSERVPQYRIDVMKRLGAEVVQYGKSQDEAYDRALRLQQERGLTMISPFDDAHIIAGQGTIGVELLEELPTIETAIVPLSGGGLIAGIAFVLKTADPSIRVIGVSMECAPAMYHSIRAGKPVEIEEQDSLADALLGGIGLDNRYTFRMTQGYVDEIVLVSEEDIAAGMFYAFDTQHLMVEGAGAVGIAALLANKMSITGQRVAVILSGSNVDASLLTNIAAQRFTSE